MTCLVWKSLVFSAKTMAESSATHDGNIVVPYNFEPDALWSSSEESNSDDNDSHAQASFTEPLGNTSWCYCAKCVTSHAQSSVPAAMNYQR